MGCAVFTLACADGGLGPTKAERHTQELDGIVSDDSTSTSGPVSAVGALLLHGGGHEPQDFFCSGTVVGRDKVVFAAHCYCDFIALDGSPAWNTARFLLPQAGGFETVFVDAVIHPSVTCGTEPNSIDLAVGTLLAAVPTAVVQELPRVFLGHVKQTWDGGGFGPTGLVVGWGDNVALGKGVRRFGNVKPVVAVGASGYAVWAANFDLQGAEIRIGDSGGALYTTLAPSGQVVLVGVTHGYTGNPEPASAQKWSATGDVGSAAANHTFLINALGGDIDGDGVPSANDNCPALSNPAQTDDDHDGIGDDCDNCAPTACMPSKPKIHCFNPGQENADSDVRGDACDRCPTDPGLHNDSDGDGVGDDCDDCSAAEPFPDCSSDLDCAAANAGFCIPGASGSAVGRCSKQADADGDEISNNCDSCLFKNQSTLNSNLLAEEREKQSLPTVESLADDCDSVPIVRLLPQKAVVLTTGPVVGDLVGPDELVTIKGERWLGRRTEGDSQSLNEKFGYKHCTCFDGNTKLSLDECVGEALQCAWNNPADPTLPEWNFPRITLPSGFPILDATGFSILTAPFSTAGAAQQDLVWSWRSDLTSGKISGSIAPCTNDPFSCETHGVVFTTTSGPSASLRDASAKLRDAFRMIDTPAVEVKAALPLTVPAACGDVPCLRWVNPTLYLRDPALSDFWHQLASPVLITPTPSAGLAARIEPALAVDATQNVVASLVQTVTNQSLMWLTPVEASYRVRRATNHGGLQAVAFPKHFTTTTEIESVVVVGSSLSRGRRAVGDTALQVASEPALTPRPREDHRAVLSGIEEATYMVGGRTLDGVATGAIWRHLLADDSWQLVAPYAGVAPSSRVVAVTYYQPTGVLFVLDLVEPALPGKAPDRTRLVAYNVRVGTAAELSTWPFKAAHNQVWLATTDDGAILLVAGQQQTFAVWRLRPKSTSVALDGVYNAPGRVLGQPTMGERDPVVAVERKGKIEYVVLNGEIFHGHQPLSL